MTVTADDAAAGDRHGDHGAAVRDWRIDHLSMACSGFALVRLDRLEEGSGDIAAGEIPVALHKPAWLTGARQRLARRRATTKESRMD